MDKELFEKIKEFTVNHAGIIGDKIHPQADLEKDLKIYGDDAIEYLIAFSKKFNVDISEFKVDKYFTPEKDYTGSFLQMFSKKNQEQIERKRITIQDLEKAVRSGKLTDDIINSELEKN